MYELIPVTGIRAFRKEVDDVWRRFFGGELLPVEREKRSFVPSVKLKDTKNGYELTAEVLSLKTEEIEVTPDGRPFDHQGLKVRRALGWRGRVPSGGAEIRQLLPQIPSAGGD